VTDEVARSSQPRLRVLIADDSGAIRDSFAALLARVEGVEIVGMAKTGIEAMEMVRRLKPDAMTLDVRMPDMNGIQVLEALKREKLEVMVLVLSGMGEDKYRERCIALGAARFFDKPTEFESMLKVLAETAASLKSAQVPPLSQSGSQPNPPPA
jgi:YesN/AraC family two-component response regulator